MTPERMYAQVLHEWGGKLSHEQVPVPAVGPHDALVKVEACGVGLTVLNYMKGNNSSRREDLPRIPGHEIIGTVVEVGAAVDGLPIGQRVMAHFYLFCGTCDMCRLAHEPLCRHLRGQVGIAADGGYAEYTALPAANWIPVPDGIDPVQATTITDAIATPLHVARRAGIGPLDVVVVIGAAGGVGIHMVQMATLFGARVVAIDRGEVKLEATRNVGAVAAFGFDDPGLAEQVRSVARGGAAVAVDFVGSRDTLTFALKSLGPRGRLVVLTAFPGVATDLVPRQLVHSELSVLGSRYASRLELAQAAELVAAKRITPIVSEVGTLADVEGIHAKLRQGTLLGRGAIKF
jgi:D-arabinose 1-dehydrogenase-like Zn-dependent alcohol dehydrogenase